MKDAEAKSGLEHLMDDHWNLELQNQIERFDKFIKFKVTNINMPADQSNETTSDSSSFAVDSETLMFKSE